jgi:hypothetical protein
MVLKNKLVLAVAAGLLVCCSITAARAADLEGKSIAVTTLDDALLDYSVKDAQNYTTIVSVDFAKVKKGSIVVCDASLEIYANLFQILLETRYETATGSGTFDPGFGFARYCEEAPSCNMGHTFVLDVPKDSPLGNQAMTVTLRARPVLFAGEFSAVARNYASFVCRIEKRK